MSQVPPCGRETPRWSVAVQLPLSPALIAGLPASRACVCVGPPLFASGPSSGFVLFRSPAPPRPHVASLARLCPPEVIVPPQSPGELLATIVLVSVAVPKL